MEKKSARLYSYKVFVGFGSKSLRVRWDSDPRHFNPLKYADWLRARRSTWLSYEPTENLRAKAVFKLNVLKCSLYIAFICEQ
jgi:hypothetical protein